MYTYSFDHVLQYCLLKHDTMPKPKAICCIIVVEFGSPHGVWLVCMLCPRWWAKKWVELAIAMLIVVLIV